jgi:bis(5'-nucleosidyl)-tetraphosphatase
MKEESCGAVIHYNDTYLLLHYEAGHWGFPKGNRESGETKLKTAKREIKEETGLEYKNLIFTDFKMDIDYFYKREGKTIYKVVTYFLAESDTDDVTISWEHTGYQWLPYQEALERLTYNNAKKVLKAAHAFLNKSSQFKQTHL